MPVPPRSFEDTLEVIQDKSYLDEVTGCFVWMGSRTGSLGYGQIRCEGRIYLLHRLIYLRLVCNDPNEAVRHSCDNPLCWNPEHLIGGTQKQNIADCVDRNRKPNGEKHYHAALTEEIVREIRSSAPNDTELAKKYGVTKTAIRHARIGRTWKHVQNQREA